MYIKFRLPGHLYIYVCINYLFPNELICDLQKVGTKFNLIDLNLIVSTCYGNCMQYYAGNDKKATKVVLAELSENLEKIDHF